MGSLDVHQHLWPEPVLRALEGRAEGPRSRWEDGGWTFASPGEPSFRIDPAEHDPAARAQELETLGVTNALVSLSPPAGIEDAAALAAWEQAAGALPPAFGWWASVPALAAQERVAWLERSLDAGAAGLCLPADRLRDPVRARAELPLLEALGHRGAPLFVHPGPAGVRGAPGWWGPCAEYVAAMTLAWQAFAAEVRPALPALGVVWALLAGLAPLHAERTALRGGPVVPEPDAWAFYETSSYGPRAVRAAACAVGAGQLLFGSDRPSAPPAPDPVARALGAEAAELARTHNPDRLLGRTWQPA